MRDIKQQLSSYQAHIDSQYPAVTSEELSDLAPGPRIRRMGGMPGWLAAVVAAAVVIVALGALAVFPREPAGTPSAVQPDATDSSVARSLPTTTPLSVAAEEAGAPTDEDSPTSASHAATAGSPAAPDGTVELAEEAGDFSAALDLVGLLHVAYWSSDEGLIKLVRCVDAECALPTETITLGDVGVEFVEGELATGQVDLALGGDGSPIVVIQHPVKGTTIFSCTDATCTTIDRAHFDDQPCTLPEGESCHGVDYPKVVVGPEGLPRILYYHRGLLQLRLAICEDRLCGIDSRSTIIIDTDIGGHGEPSINIQPDGTMVIGHWVELPSGLVESKVVACIDNSCTGSAELTFDNAVAPRITSGPDGSFFVWYRSGPLYVAEGGMDRDAVVNAWNLMVAACDPAGCREPQEVEVGWEMLTAWSDELQLESTSDGEVVASFGYWSSEHCLPLVQTLTLDPVAAVAHGVLSLEPVGGLSIDLIDSHGFLLVVYTPVSNGLRLARIPLDGPVLVDAGSLVVNQCAIP